MREVALIRFISAHSSRYGDKLLDFMERYGLSNLASATEEQLTEYVEREFPSFTVTAIKLYEEVAV